MCITELFEKITTIIITRTGANFPFQDNIQVEINLALIKIAISSFERFWSKTNPLNPRDSSVLHPPTDTSISWNNKLDVFLLVKVFGSIVWMDIGTGSSGGAGS